MAVPHQKAGVASFAPPRPERSVGELFGELATETSSLVRQELKLATTELTHKATHAGKQAIYVVAGSMLGVLCFGSLVLALVLGLGTMIPLWASALIVGVAIGLVAYLVARKGIAALKRMELAPTETIKSLQENKSWAHRQIR